MTKFNFDIEYVQVSLNSPSSIDKKHVTGDKVGCGGREVDHGAGHILRSPYPSERDALEHVAIELFVFEHGLGKLRLYKGGSDCVDIDPMRRPFQGQKFCELVTPLCWSSTQPAGGWPQSRPGKRR